MYLITQQFRSSPSKAIGVVARLKPKGGVDSLGSDDWKGIGMLNIRIRDHEVLPKLACDLTEIAVA